MPTPRTKAIPKATNNTLAWLSHCLPGRMVIVRLLLVPKDDLRGLYVLGIHLAAEDGAGAFPTHSYEFAQAGFIAGAGVRGDEEHIGPVGLGSALVEVEIPKITFGQICLVRLAGLTASQGSGARVPGVGGGAPTK